MMYSRGKALIALIALSMFCGTNYCVAEEVLNDEEGKNSRDGYHLSVGAGYLDYESPLREAKSDIELFFNGRYQKYGFFAEFASDPTGRKNLPALGYNFYNAEHWNLDLIAAVVTGRTEFNYELDGEFKQISGGPTRGVGFRAQGAWGNSVVQLVALPYFHEEFRSNSAINYASIWAGHRWQVRNWSVSGQLGAIYQSGALLDHNLGVTQDEADQLVRAYEPSSGIDYTAQVDLSYPLRKNLLFQMYARHTTYSDAFLSSPMIELIRSADGRPEDEREFGILFNYVFW